MYSLDEIIKQNNPKPGDYEKQIARNKARNSKVKKIDLDKLSSEEKQELLNKLFEGR